MNETLLLWIAGHVLATTAAIVTIYVRLISRIVAIETLLRMMGEKAARALHSPADHHGIDPLLDKYLDANYDLTFSEWDELHEKCEEIIQQQSSTPGEKSLASWLSAICEHKLLCGKSNII